MPLQYIIAAIYFFMTSPRHSLRHPTLETRAKSHHPLQNTPLLPFQQFQAFCQKQQFKKETVIQKVDKRKAVWNTEAWPFSAIGQIESVFVKSGYTEESKGTVTMVGPNVGITAAHNLYSEKYGEARSSVVTLGLNGNYYLIKCYVKKPFIISPHFKNLEFWDRIEHDYAFVVLDTDDLGDFSGFLGMRSNFNPKNEQIGLFGYPKDKWVYDEGEPLISLWGDVGQVEVLASNSNIFVYSISTDSGQSGAALLYSKGYESKVIGLHTNGGKSLNLGLRLTNQILEYARKQLYKLHGIVLY